LERLDAVLRKAPLIYNLKFREGLLSFGALRFVFLFDTRKVILPVFLYACENWFLTLRDKHRLRMLENRVLRGMFGTKRGENNTMRSL